MTDEKGTRICGTCYGTGEVGTERGPVDCPDCGGVGYLPGPEVLVEWRSRDIERAHTKATDRAHEDITWLAAELRRARAALLSVYSLACEAEDSDLIRAIRFEANRALGIHPLMPGETELTS